MITTTLKALRENDACVEGYNRLVRTLQGKAYSDKDAERETHIRYAYKDPIPLAVILESNGLDDTIWALRACEQTPAMVRAERLFAVWCARQVQHLMTDARSIDALNVAEQHANGNATDAQLAAAWAAARDAALEAAHAARAAARDAAWAAAWAAARDAARDAAWAAAWAAAWDAALAAALAAQKEKFIAVFCGDELNTEVLK